MPCKSQNATIYPKYTLLQFLLYPVKRKRGYTAEAVGRAGDLRLILTEDLMQNPEQSRFSCDGYNPDGLPTLLCVNGDLKRLIRFITQFQYQGRQGEIICFDFQKEAIREYCGEKTKSSTVDLEAVRRQFLA